MKKNQNKINYSLKKYKIFINKGKKIEQILKMYFIIMKDFF